MRTTGEDTATRVKLIQEINRGEITSVQQLHELGIARIAPGVCVGAFVGALLGLTVYRNYLVS